MGMLSISDFSDMCHLPPQTLRYYHAEGLLVPAEVDERTGYRSYAFEQVERAMVVSVLREAGLSVKLVRRALDEPDLAPGIVRQHAADVERERRAQDDAIRAAEGLFGTQPEATLVEVPAMRVASRPVPGTPPGRDAREWDVAEQMIAAATAQLVADVETAGGRVTGTPWRAFALETPEQDRQVLDGEGPFWLVKVPFVGDAAGGFDVQELEEHREVSVFLPGRTSMAQYSTAIVRLYAYPCGDFFVNTARLRMTVRPGGVEVGAPVMPLQSS